MLGSLLTAPLRGLVFIARKVDEAVQQEREAEAQAAMAELRRLHAAYEAGQIDDAAFEKREAELLDKLEALDDDG